MASYLLKSQINIKKKQHNHTVNQLITRFNINSQRSALGKPTQALLEVPRWSLRGLPGLDIAPVFDKCQRASVDTLRVVGDVVWTGYGVATSVVCAYDSDCVAVVALDV